MPRPRPILVFAVLCASCATAPRAPDEGGKPWVRADGEHLWVETNLGEDAAPQLVRELETARAAMTAALFPGARAPRQRLQVIVIGHRELDAMRSELRGLHTDRPGVGTALIVSSEDHWKRGSVMRHELAHAVIAENFPQVPSWLNEGLATLLGSADVDQRTGEVTWGGIVGIKDAEFGTGPMPLEALVDPDRTKPPSGWFEESAGVLLHMLARVYPRELTNLLELLSRGEPFDDAFDEAFPERRSWGREYSHEQFFVYEDVGKAQAQLPLTNATPRPMADADVHATLALLNAEVGDMIEEGPARAALMEASKRHRQRALALDPTEMLAAALELDETEATTSSGQPLVDAVMQAHPDDWRGWFWRAMGRSRSRSEVGESEAAARAYELAPERHDVLEVAAQVALHDQRWDDAARLARAAFRRDPRCDVSPVVLFLALERQGKCEDARALFESERTAIVVRQGLRTPRWRKVSRPAPCEVR
jgi:hypothetical protein